MINEISDYIYSFKNKVLEANDVANTCADEFSKYAKQLDEENFKEEFEENFLTILGYTYRLDDIKQRLFFTFQEAVYAIDLDKLMRNEDSLRLNSIVYTYVLDALISEYNGKEVSSELKQKAIDTYKKIEERKAKENTKYHMYQY